MDRKRLDQDGQIGPLHPLVLLGPGPERLPPHGGTLILQEGWPDPSSLRRKPTGPSSNTLYWLACYIYRTLLFTDFIIVYLLGFSTNSSDVLMSASAKLLLLENLLYLNEK